MQGNKQAYLGFFLNRDLNYGLHKITQQQLNFSTSEVLS